ncbi:cobaltochelatase subunit CobN [Sphingobium phenoxybenzoativorans]|jgi:cobaltochelatase CobN|uniref:Cobaltochelatase subunit CobN n=1 Tax=Sphingobium phenoxybenzoativorans TaxID=1592790 RepID=A0A975Q334_9SPHN|nr:MULTISPECIES: cobaltochelatase subunit CobN [Sphingobium]MEA3388462.1 cobaltochelatase subunit CobN [Pseudomonadota bacterium]QUT07630.1 cobaltochelatase subunit CobN [Sphingobium phenoxybenzoativorans]
MHVIFRETHGMEETAVPQDLGQEPADLVVLSFSDSDLGAFAAAWHMARAADAAFPSLRIANLAALMHPLSVDTYVERTLFRAKAILIRLIGGTPYWSYGLQQVEALARSRGIALAVLPGDGWEDARLDAASTVPVSALRELAQLCDAGGAGAAHAALAGLARLAGLTDTPAQGCEPLAVAGGWHPDHGVVDPDAFAHNPGRPLVLIIFYRSYLTAHDLDPFAALHAVFERRGFDALSIFVPSLKAPQVRDQVDQWVRGLGPAAIINATAFSARGEDGSTSLDGAGVPVFQLALATSGRAAWATTSRGLSPADLAMHVVLPEIDGRVFAGVASFKEAGTRDPDLAFARNVHRADPDRVEAIAARVAGWIALAQRPVAERRVALVLSTYPGKVYQMAHAVGLDALASAEAILADLAQAGYATAAQTDLAMRLESGHLQWPLAEYRKALTALPDALRADLSAVWGEPEADVAVVDGAFCFAALAVGNALVALQPERGGSTSRDEDYHDLSRCPRHGYVAFYLWLRARAVDALVHIGAHGTLEWLPGKSVALSDTCWPEALTGAMPVIYPFIVNDPGEAAQAKRRIGAVTIGHVPPPLAQTESGAGLARIEALLDEFSNADGLDPARRDRLQAAIREEARTLGLEAELGLDSAATLVEAITRIDRFVCDVKESQFGDGLHVFGCGDQGAAERAGLLAALDGRRVPPGPSGSPFRGRSDVLPTGRNLYAIDPRVVPSRAAHAQGVTLAEELIRRHLQDHGDYPRGLVVDLWGSATMRTAGEEFVMALHLLGAKPVWDMTSERVTGVEILPLALLDRPRIDVTLRVSGLFRDAFPALPMLFGQAVRALCLRDEPADWNPFAGQAAAPRVYGPAPGRYGLGLGDAAEVYTDAARRAAGEAWLAASDHAFDATCDATGAVPDPDGLRRRVEGADAFVHLQDLPETDLLLAADYVAHEAGFAAAKALSGGVSALYHLDNRDPLNPVARSLTEEIARVVRARAAHPGWIAGMMRHGFRGGAELAATLDHMGAFAHLSGSVPPHLFDLYHDATLGQADVRAFLERENPGALAAMEARFAALHAAGLWQTRRNSIIASLPISVGLEDRA